MAIGFLGYIDPASIGHAKELDVNQIANSASHPLIMKTRCHVNEAIELVNRGPVRAHGGHLGSNRQTSHLNSRHVRDTRSCYCTHCLCRAFSTSVGLCTVCDWRRREFQIFRLFVFRMSTYITLTSI